jgi:hypothetical protein
MACCSPAKAEQVERKKAETVKLALVPSHPRPLYRAPLRFVHDHLRRRFTTADSSCGELAHFELRPHFLDLKTPARRDAQ